MRRTILAAWILLTFAPAAAGAPEDSCVDYTAGVHRAGNLRTHYAFAVATYGPTAYVAADDSLYAVDISDPCAVRLVPSLDLGRTMQAASKCGLGPSSANAFLDITEHFRSEILGRVPATKE